MKQGWIKLHRKLTDSSVFDNPKLLKTWIWCLCKASHTEHEVIVGKHFIKLQPGQFVFGRLKAADVLKMNDRTVYDYMKMLEKMEMLRIDSTNKYSVVTIENWAFYQEGEDEFQHQSTYQSKIQSTIENHTYKNDKNERECIKNERRIFVAPSVDEVAEYCHSRKNGIDAEAFVSFYQSKGWMIGKSKMKDWKAAVRTWERNRTQKGGNVNEGRAEQRAFYDQEYL